MDITIIIGKRKSSVPLKVSWKMWGKMGLILTLFGRGEEVNVKNNHYFSLRLEKL